jgi:hypothetical protein
MRLTLIIALLAGTGCFPLDAALNDARRTNPSDPFDAGPDPAGDAGSTTAADAGSTGTCTPNGVLDEGEECDPLLEVDPQWFLPPCSDECTLHPCNEQGQCEDGLLCVVYEGVGQVCMARLGMFWEPTALGIQLSRCVRPSADGPEFDGPCGADGSCFAGYECEREDQPELNDVVLDLAGHCLPSDETPQSSPYQMTPDDLDSFAARDFGVLVTNPKGEAQCVREGCVTPPGIEFNSGDSCPELHGVTQGDERVFDGGQIYCGAAGECRWRECAADPETTVGPGDQYCMQAHRIREAECIDDWCVLPDDMWLDSAKAFVTPQAETGCQPHEECTGNDHLGAACGREEVSRSGLEFCVSCEEDSECGRLERAGFQCINNKCQLPCPQPGQDPTCVGDSECVQLPGPLGNVCTSARGHGEGPGRWERTQCNTNDAESCGDSMSCTYKPLVDHEGVTLAEAGRCEGIGCSEDNPCPIGLTCTQDSGCQAVALCSSLGGACLDGEEGSCTAHGHEVLCFVDAGMCSDDSSCPEGLAMACSSRGGEAEKECECSHDSQCGVNGRCMYNYCFQLAIEVDGTYTCPGPGDDLGALPLLGICSPS